MKPRLYIAGPLFSAAEKSFNREVKTVLSQFFAVYLPQDDGELLVDLVADGENVDTAMNRVFEGDLEAIRNSDVLLMILDGRAPDEGACFELGYAYSLNKLCVGLQTDVRRLLTIGNNPMIVGALRQTFFDIAELVRWATQYPR